MLKTDEQIGQLLIIGISGHRLLNEEALFIKEKNIGGVLLFGRNYSNPIQLVSLINSIQELRARFPLFIAVDQEGGRVMRFREGFTQFPSMSFIADHFSIEICFQISSIMAAELKACGINLNLSPVCDLAINKHNKVIGDRSFGSKKERVIPFISSALKGMHAEKILTCPKHFIGHGRSLGDSHLEKVIIKTSLEDLWRDDLQVFRVVIDHNVEFVMISHLIIEAIDSQNPASLSKKVQNILRDDLGYSKLILSDDMDMKAISKFYKREESVQMAVKSEVDMMIYSDFKSARMSYDKIKKNVQEKNIKREEIEPKLKRIEDCKEKYLSDYSPIQISDVLKNLNTKKSQVFRDHLI